MRQSRSSEAEISSKLLHEIAVALPFCRPVITLVRAHVPAVVRQDEHLIACKLGIASLFQRNGVAAPPDMPPAPCTQVKSSHLAGVRNTSRASSFRKKS